MSKRFTDTEKWDREWFIELSSDLKIFWMFLLDKCDHAGIWKVNKHLVKTYTGINFNSKKILNAFNNKIIPLSDTRWFVPKFIEQQVFDRHFRKTFNEL